MFYSIFLTLVDKWATKYGTILCFTALQRRIWRGKVPKLKGSNLEGGSREVRFLSRGHSWFVELCYEAHPNFLWDWWVLRNVLLHCVVKALTTFILLLRPVVRSASTKSCMRLGWVSLRSTFLLRHDIQRLTSVARYSYLKPTHRVLTHFLFSSVTSELRDLVS